MVRVKSIVGVIAVLFAVFGFSLTDAARLSRISSVTDRFSTMFAGGGAYEISGGILQDLPITSLFFEGEGSPEDAVPVAASELSFARGSGDYPFALQYQGQNFAIPVPARDACAIAEFVRSGSPVVYTAIGGVPADWVQQYGLVPASSDYSIPGYAHSAFSANAGGVTVPFLRELDSIVELTGAGPLVRPLSPGERMTVMQAMRSTPDALLQRSQDLRDRPPQNQATTLPFRGPPSALSNVYTLRGQHDVWIFSDANTAYEAFLTDGNELVDGPVVDVAGLPLRYTISMAADGAVVHEVLVFEFPDSVNHPNYPYVQFFHNVALMRTALSLSPGQYQTVVGSVCSGEPRV